MYDFRFRFSSPLAHVSVTDVSTGPHEGSPGSLHLLPDQPPLLLRLNADEVHTPGLAPVPRTGPVPGHGGELGLLVPSDHLGLRCGELGEIGDGGGD